MRGKSQNGDPYPFMSSYRPSGCWKMKYHPQYHISFPFPCHTPISSQIFPSLCQTPILLLVPLQIKFLFADVYHTCPFLLPHPNSLPFSPLYHNSHLPLLTTPCFLLSFIFVLGGVLYLSNVFQEGKKKRGKDN